MISLDELLAAQQLPQTTFDDWVSAGLVEPAQLGDDGLALERDQAVRFLLLAGARKALRGRCTPETLAFALARAGDRSLPVELVKRGLVARLATTFGLARRSLQRSTGLAPRFGTVKSVDVLDAAERLADGIAEHVPAEQRNGVAEVVRTAAFGALSLIYLSPEVRAQSRRLRDTLELLGAQPDSAAQLPVRSFIRRLSRVADTLADARDLVTLDRRTSPLFRKLEGLPESGFWTAFDIWPELSNAIARIWTRFGDVVSLPQFSAAERETFDTLLLTSLVLFCADENGAAELEAYWELVRNVSEKLEGALDKVVGLAQIALAVRRLLPDRDPQAA